MELIEEEIRNMRKHIKPPFVEEIEHKQEFVTSLKDECKRLKDLLYELYYHFDDIIDVGIIKKRGCFFVFFDKI